MINSSFEQIANALEQILIRRRKSLFVQTNKFFDQTNYSFV